MTSPRRITPVRLQALTLAAIAAGADEVVVEETPHGVRVRAIRRDPPAPPPAGGDRGSEAALDSWRRHRA